MISIVITAALISYLFMLAAYFLHRQRWLHIPVMFAIIVFDVSMPFYLYLHHNWYKRLIVQGELISSLLWMHLGLLIAMFILDGVQVITARKVIQGDKAARNDHHTQGKALLIVRGLVIVTGAILENPA